MTETISLSPHKIPKNHRVYAIGDVHGHVDVLKRMHSTIMDDVCENPIENITIIHLGDYINRGPDSKGVIEFLMELSQNKNQIEYVHLFGNHENGILEFIDDPLAENRDWYCWPEENYLKSYGIDNNQQDAVKLAEMIKEAVPDAHWKFKRNMPYYHVVGDFAFVHNGPRPGIKLEEQSKEDLVNNREPFMSTEEPHEYFIVHGHTSTSDYQVDVRPNRINLDTGLFYKDGVLTCGVFEGSEVRFFTKEK
ncbi:MAG: metallophosphoesterase [Pseudomonadota bacterium]